MVKLTSLLFAVLLSSTYYVENGSAIKSIACRFCFDLISNAYDLLGDDREVESIVSALNSACDRVYPVKDDCVNYVNQYTPMILDLIANTTNPFDVCTLIQLCDKAIELKSPLLVAKRDLKVDRCDKCLVDIKSIQTDLKLARKEHFPKLQRCCGQYPTPDGMCDNYIDFMVKIYDDLESKLDPRNTCMTFGACSESLTSKPDDGQSTIKKIEPDCFLCKQVFRLLYKVIEKQSKVDIESALDKVCDTMLPTADRKSCYKYIDTYTTQLIDFIQTHTDANVACHIIGLCREQFEENLNSLSSQLNLINTPQVFSSIECDNCNKSVAWAAVTVKSYASSLNGMIENTCLEYTQNHLSCKSYMADQFNYDTSQLISKTSPDYFCTIIFGQCPLTKGPN
ncbi:uncharacterized protein LOC128394210 [Panonychus citri]|uniref:uncharacterized protein LOC128394210 n=1 Tax=Panonychus citri TaxID=50023 RepID=UPI00230786E5|nr:uncharacterized protein LOC128394210 [Panonychus citri]